jgi:hypothetical protein
VELPREKEYREQKPDYTFKKVLSYQELFEKIKL